MTDNKTETALDNLSYFLKSHKESRYFNQAIDYTNLELTFREMMTDPLVSSSLRGFVLGCFGKRLNPDKSAFAFEKLMELLVNK